MAWYQLSIVLFVALHLGSGAVIVSNSQLKAMVEKLQKEVSTLKAANPQPVGHCTINKCGRCRCIEDFTIHENYYCDCRNLPAKRDCKAFYLTGHYTKGIYTVTMNGLRKANVFCDGLGWTVIQRRMDGSVDFNRPWKDYKEGFGKLQGEFWIGNENLHALTTQALYQGGSELSVFMKSRRSWDLTYEANYKHFQVESELANYKLHAKYLYGNGDSLTYHDNMEFSTFDKDNDQHATRNCARDLHGGWWYRACSRSNLNGAYDSFENLKPEERVDWESLLFYRTQGWVEMKVMRSK